MRPRGIDLTIFAPRALGMEHLRADAGSNLGSRAQRPDLRVCNLFPSRFVGGLDLAETTKCFGAPLLSL
jgi:hypothetical protein